VAHVDDSAYPSQVLPADPQLKPHFLNNYLKYFRAGYRAGVHGLTQQLNGMQVMISGNIPIAAGLSSSSALCVCSALASLHANTMENAG
jgi:galactokinase